MRLLKHTTSFMSVQRYFDGNAGFSTIKPGLLT